MRGNNKNNCRTKRIVLIFIFRGTGSSPEKGGRNGRPSDVGDGTSKRPPGAYQCGIGLLRYRGTGRRNPTIPRRLHAAAFGAAELQATLSRPRPVITGSPGQSPDQVGGGR